MDIIVAHPQTRILLSNEKEQTADNGATLTTLQSVRLSERSQSQISTYYMLYLHGVLENIKWQGQENQYGHQKLGVRKGWTTARAWMNSLEMSFSWLCWGLPDYLWSSNFIKLSFTICKLYLNKSDFKTEKPLATQIRIKKENIQANNNENKRGGLIFDIKKM